MNVKDFIKHNFRHFNASTVVYAAEAYVKHVEKGNKMMITLAGAMSTAELGLTLAEMIRQVKALGLETCVTLGTLKEGQAEKFKEAGLDYYNHNLDTSRDYYEKIITTRTFDERLDTIKKIRKKCTKLGK